MRLIETGSFPIIDIQVVDRLRMVDERQAQGLAEIIKATGLKHPIEIVRIGNEHRLVSGAHRLAAAKILGWSDIPARVVEPETDKPELEIRMSEIAENIGRRDLSPLDRAAHVAELKHIFLRLNGETRGGDRKSEKSKRQQLPFWSLSDDLATKMQLSERTVRADVALFDGLSPATRKRIALLPIASNRAQLVQLAKHEPAIQKAVLDLLLAEKPKAANVNQALSLHLNKIDLTKPMENTMARFQRLWASASVEARAQIALYVKAQKV